MAARFEHRLTARVWDVWGYFKHVNQNARSQARRCSQLMARREHRRTASAWEVWCQNHHVHQQVRARAGRCARLIARREHRRLYMLWDTLCYVHVASQYEGQLSRRQARGCTHLVARRGIRHVSVVWSAWSQIREENQRQSWRRRRCAYLAVIRTRATRVAVWGAWCQYRQHYQLKRRQAGQCSQHVEYRAHRYMEMVCDVWCQYLQHQREQERKVKHDTAVTARRLRHMRRCSMVTCLDAWVACWKDCVQTRERARNVAKAYIHRSMCVAFETWFDSVCGSWQVLRMMQCHSAALDKQDDMLRTSHLSVAASKTVHKSTRKLSQHWFKWSWYAHNRRTERHRLLVVRRRILRRLCADSLSQWVLAICLQARGLAYDAACQRVLRGKQRAVLQRTVDGWRMQCSFSSSLHRLLARAISRLCMRALVVFTDKWRQAAQFSLRLTAALRILERQICLARLRTVFEIWSDRQAQGCMQRSVVAASCRRYTQRAFAVAWMRWRAFVECVTAVGAFRLHTLKVHAGLLERKVRRRVFQSWAWHSFMCSRAAVSANYHVQRCQNRLRRRASQMFVGRWRAWGMKQRAQRRLVECLALRGCWNAMIKAFDAWRQVLLLNLKISHGQTAYHWKLRQRTHQLTHLLLSQWSRLTLAAARHRHHRADKYFTYSRCSTFSHQHSPQSLLPDFSAWSALTWAHRGVRACMKGLRNKFARWCRIRAVKAWQYATFVLGRTRAQSLVGRALSEQLVRRCCRIIGMWKMRVRVRARREVQVAGKCRHLVVRLCKELLARWRCGVLVRRWMERVVEGFERRRSLRCLHQVRMSFGLTSPFCLPPSGVMSKVHSHEGKQSRVLFRK